MEKYWTWLGRQRVRVALLAVALPLIVLVAACGDPTPAPVDKVTLSLGYIPNVQFAPYYVAQDKGYYKDENIDLTLQYGQVNDLLKVVGQGDIQFANVSGDELVPARAQGVPVTYIFTQYYRYPIAAASIEGKGPTLNSVADLKGHSIGVPGPYGSNYIGLLAMLKAANLTDKDIDMQSIGYTQVEALAQGKVDIAMVYSMNEPVQLQQQGNKVSVLQVSDIANLVSVGVVAGDKLIKENPDLVQRFVRATTKGVQDTLKNTSEAFDISMKRTPEISGDAAELQRQVLTATVAFMTPPADRQIGSSDAQAWTFTEQFVREIGLSTTAVDPTTLYTNNFIGK